MHFDGPSMSSRNFSLFLVLSTDVFNYCTVGTRCGCFPPAASSLIFAPIAACSCFSTAVIFAWISSSSTCLQVSIVIWAPGCVDVSFNWSTIPSTSWSCSCILVSVSSKTVTRAHVSSLSRAGMVSIVLFICSSCFVAYSSKYCIRSWKLCTILSSWAVLSYMAICSSVCCCLSVISCFMLFSSSCCCLANWFRIWVCSDASVLRSWLSCYTCSAS